MYCFLCLTTEWGPFASICCKCLNESNSPFYHPQKSTLSYISKQLGGVNIVLCVCIVPELMCRIGQPVWRVLRLSRLITPMNNKGQHGLFGVVTVSNLDQKIEQCRTVQKSFSWGLSTGKIGYIPRTRWTGCHCCSLSQSRRNDRQTGTLMPLVYYCPIQTGECQ